MKRLGAGMVFLVDRNTEAECLRRRLGALPAGSRAVAARVAAGDLVFVFNTATKVRYSAVAAAAFAPPAETTHAGVLRC